MSIGGTRSAISKALYDHHLVFDKVVAAARANGA
jgi:hypothetical protein